ncbi:MAG: ribose 5-phosphate isomerase B [Candidatus Omnitrophica bacterium]|nr:ribose 5-phosphate isomerase B [Candidatus Omnitrophota bacterium]
MRIYIGADHRGVLLKNQIVDFLGKKDIDVIDVGSHDPKKPCDYPKFSFRVAQSVAKDKNARGILVCMTGIGHSIAANRVIGARAALCYNKKAAKLSRAHNNANILVLGSEFVTHKEIFQILNIWLTTPFEGGRHLRRINQIDRISKKKCCG